MGLAVMFGHQSSFKRHLIGVFSHVAVDIAASIQSIPNSVCGIRRTLVCARICLVFAMNVLSIAFM